MGEDEYFNQRLNSHLKEEEDYSLWVEKHEDVILESYIETLSIDDAPNEFINDMYERSL